MTRRIVTFSVPAVSAIVAALTFSACSNSSNNGTPTDGGGATTSSGGTGAGGATGGTGAGGATGGTGAGGAATGGMTSTDAGKLGYVCEEKAPTLDPGGTGAVNAACCGGLGECTLASSLTTAPGSASFAHDTCKKSTSGDLLCAPAKAGDAATAQAIAAGLYSKCTADIGGTNYEGRCIPGCFVQGNPNAGQLSSKGCGADGGPLGLLCAPCYNPVDATDTGACRQAPGDAPKDAKPDAYPTCGAVDGGMKLGTCVPSSLALNSGNPAAPNLKEDDCAADSVCVPTPKANNLNSCFGKCTTGLTGQFVDGACVPQFVVRDVSPGGLALLHQQTCGTDELCAPCADPLNPGKASHACE